MGENTDIYKYCYIFVKETNDIEKKYKTILYFICMILLMVDSLNIYVRNVIRLTKLHDFRRATITM